MDREEKRAQWYRRAQEQLEQIEEDRKREADRLASEANPPKPYDGSRCAVVTQEGIAVPYWVCPLGTVGCSLNHDASDPIPAAVIEARIAANQAARKRDGEHRQD